MEEEEAADENEDEEDEKEGAVAAPKDAASTEAALVVLPLFSFSLSSSTEWIAEETMGMEVEVLLEMDD